MLEQIPIAKGSSFFISSEWGICFFKENFRPPAKIGFSALAGKFAPRKIVSLFRRNLRREW